MWNIFSCYNFPFNVAGFSPNLHALVLLNAIDLVHTTSSQIIFLIFEDKGGRDKLVRSLGLADTKKIEDT